MSVSLEDESEAVSVQPGHIISHITASKWHGGGKGSGGGEPRKLPSLHTAKALLLPFSREVM
eukprot:973807-Pelagomonas_calceolata.AAC.1